MMMRRRMESHSSVRVVLLCAVGGRPLSALVIQLTRACVCVCASAGATSSCAPRIRRTIIIHLIRCSP